MDEFLRNRDNVFDESPYPIIDDNNDFDFVDDRDISNDHTKSSILNPSFDNEDLENLKDI